MRAPFATSPTPPGSAANVCPGPHTLPPLGTRQASSASRSGDQRQTRDRPVNPQSRPGHHMERAPLRDSDDDHSTQHPQDTGTRAHAQSSLDHQRMDALESQIQTTTTTTKALLQEALIAQAEIGRAWQMLQGMDRHEVEAHQRRLLKDHIRSITNVVHRLTSELDEAEQRAATVIARLRADLSTTTGAVRHSMQTLTASLGTTQQQQAREIAAMHTALTVMTRQMQTMTQQRDFDSQRIAGLQNQLASWKDIVSQAASKQQVFDMHASLHHKLDGLASAQVSVTEKLRSDIDATSNGLQDVRQQVQVLAKDVTHTVASTADADAAVRQQLDTQIDHIRGHVQQKCADVEASVNATTTELEGKMTAMEAIWKTTLGPVLDAKVRKATEDARQAVDVHAATVRATLAQSNHELERKLEKVIAISQQRFGTVFNVFATKDDLKRHEDVVRDTTLATQTVARSARADWTEHRAEVDGKIAALEALLHTKISDLNGKIDSNNFVLYCQ
eukprot:m.40840 g.40840  ORF g.40840 m.40840 type:complete len:504 (+) comp14866_c0_seq2:346-1857(+)